MFNIDIFLYPQVIIIFTTNNIFLTTALLFTRINYYQRHQCETAVTKVLPI